MSPTLVTFGCLVTLRRRNNSPPSQVARIWPTSAVAGICALFTFKPRPPARMLLTLILAGWVGEPSAWGAARLAAGFGVVARATIGMGTAAGAGAGAGAASLSSAWLAAIAGAGG